MKIYQRSWRTPDGESRRALTYSLLFYVRGVRHHMSLHTRDRRAAELKASAIVRKAEMHAAGICDVFEAQAEKPLAEHVADFLSTLAARGVVTKYVADRKSCLDEYVGATGAMTTGDLDLARASAWISEIRGTGLSHRSVNRRVAALIQFGRWMARGRRMAFDPFSDLKTLNEDEDRRHVRRALTPDEAERLVAATRVRALARAGAFHAKANPERRAKLDRTRAKMTRLGEVRALIYLLALGTGLRRGELRRLRWCDLALGGESPHVTIPAASAKSRRVQTVDLHPRVIEALVAFRPATASPTDTVLPPRTMPGSRTFDADLAAAGIAKTDAAGRVLDFHALRTTTISWLASTGAHPRVAQSVARHADVTTTMRRYTDMALLDTRGAVAKLPLPGVGSVKASARSA